MGFVATNLKPLTRALTRHQQCSMATTATTSRRNNKDNDNKMTAHQQQAPRTNWKETNMYQGNGRNKHETNDRQITKCMWLCHWLTISGICTLLSQSIMTWVASRTCNMCNFHRDRIFACHDIQDALTHFLKEEQLTGDERWRWPVNYHF